MTIVDSTRFFIGIAFAVVGVAVLVSARGSRGFTQRRQAGAMFLIGAAALTAIGLGLIDF
jgi:hypothetical protein